MPELPEVESLRRALLPLIGGRVLREAVFFRPDLRFPIPAKILQKNLTGHALVDIRRRGKYLLLQADTGAMLWHLGMSGRVVRRPSKKAAEPHTHAVFTYEPDIHLHFVDPRRFGAILWVPPEGTHKLLDHLGLDPLDPATTAEGLRQRARTCKGPVKHFLMNATRLAGVGNIYACEALFDAGISPRRGAHRLSLKDWHRLLDSLRRTLQKSIAAGGTTLRDFFNTDGSPGYFAVDLAVYDREGKPCPRCGRPIARIVQTARSTFFCRTCQKK